MPCGARSSDSDFTKACCAALTTVEAMALACGTLPAWPMMTMKRPPPCLRMIGVTQRASSQAPSTLVLKCRSKSALAISASRPGRCVPALLTTMSMPPKALTTLSTSDATSAGSQISATKPLAVGDFSAASAASSSGAITAADGDIAAFGGQPLRDAKADAAGAAGDQRGLGRQSEIHAASSTENVAVIAAVDADRAAADKARAIRHQERHQIGDLVRPAGAAQADWHG